MWCEWCKWRVVIYGTHTTVGVSNIHIHPCTSLSLSSSVQHALQVYILIQHTLFVFTHHDTDTHPTSPP